MEKNLNSPPLRFPEFKEEWDIKKLEDIAEKITDGTHDTPKPTKEGVPFLTAIHIRDGFIDYDNCYYLPIEEHKLIYKRCNPEKGDLLVVNIGAGTATCAMNIVDYEFSLKNVALIKPNQIIIFPSYLEQVQRKNSSKIFNHLTAGGAQPFLSLNEIGKIWVSFPSLPEQQKIAAFLTSVDERIAQLTKKKALLEQYKKGVMQKIFSQEIRFKDDNGKEFEEWEGIKLGEVANRITRKNKENNLNVLTISAQYGLINQEDFFKKSVSAKDLTGYYLLEKDDFAYNKSYSTGYPMGAIKRLKKYEKGVVSTLYICFKFQQQKVNFEFIEQYFESGLHNREIEQIAQEGARNHGLLNIGLSDFFNTQIQLPCIEEQTKIANFLLAIDKKIEGVDKQLEQTKRWKKGLLQQMFC